MTTICSMTVNSSGVRWTTTDHDGCAQLNGATTLMAGMNPQQLTELSVRQAMPAGGIVVLMDGDNPASVPDEFGATPLFAPHLFGNDTVQCHTVMPHAALAAVIASGRCNLGIAISTTKVDTSRPYGLVRITEYDDRIVFSTSVVGTDGQLVAWDPRGPGQPDASTQLEPSATDVVEQFGLSMQGLLPRLGGDVSSQGVIAVYEGIMDGIGVALEQLLRARFADAPYALRLQVDPMATTTGGLLLAKQFMA